MCNRAKIEEYFVTFLKAMERGTTPLTRSMRAGLSTAIVDCFICFLR